MPKRCSTSTKRTAVSGHASSVIQPEVVTVNQYVHASVTLCTTKDTTLKAPRIAIYQTSRALMFAPL